MNTPSNEQQCIIDTLKHGKNVIVDACAGSGKSTTVLSCAKQMSDLNFVQITFNKLLQEEVKDSIEKFDLKNIQVFTFHGLAVKYYNSDCHNDMGIRKLMREECPSRVPIPPLDVMVLDECQDMTKLYYDLIHKFLLDMGQNVFILILGDEKQALYQFKGADTRFLTMADVCWKYFPNLYSNEFVQHKLQMSYRVTDPIRKFVNQSMLGYERMKSCRDGLSVVYFKHPLYQIAKIICGRIKTLILRDKARYDEIFILSRSLKYSNLIVRILENWLVEQGIPCFIPSGDNKDEMDTRVIQNKLVFSTFHASKGRQRPYVFVLGFDDSHFAYFANDKDPKICPNELYVACTRASKMLFVFESKDKNSSMLPFLQLNHNDMMKSDFISFQGIPCGRKPIVEKKSDSTDKCRKVTPTDLIKFLPEKTLDILTPLVDEVFQTITSHSDSLSLSIPSVHQTTYGTFEDVSDLNGTALPIMYCDHLRESNNMDKVNVLHIMISNSIKNLEENKHMYLRNLFENISDTCETVEEYLYLTCLYTAIQECLYSRLKQIPTDNYNWLSDEIIKQCFDSLDKTIGEECKMGVWKTECSLIKNSDDMAHANIDMLLREHFPDTVYRFSARIDLMTQQSLWELKCTSQLTLENKLQLIIYAWLYEYRHELNKKEINYHLLNFKTHEHLQLNATKEQLSTIVIEILKGKEKTLPITDEEFVEQFSRDH